jgi:Tfp pilus assembly major pilin PilA
MADAVAELIALIGDENDRKSAQQLFEKYEPLRGGVLRQADYDRLMNEAKQKIADGDIKVKKYEDWYNKNLTRHEELLKMNGDLETENGSLKKQVEDAVKKAAAGGSGDGQPVDQEAIVQSVMAKLGGKPVTQAELKEAAKATVNEFAQTLQKDFFEKTFPQATRWQSRFLDAKLSYHDEFKKRLDDETFMKFMTDNKIEDPTEGYNRFVAADRQKIQVEKEVERRLAEEKAKHPAGTSGSEASVDINSPIVSILSKPIPGSVPEGARPGDGSAALRAAEAMRNEGKF